MSNYFSSSEKARDESDDECSAGARYASGLITCSAAERSILSPKLLLQRRLLLLLLRTRHQHNKRRVDVSTYPTTTPQQAPADVASQSPHSLTRPGAPTDRVHATRNESVPIQLDLRGGKLGSCPWPPQVRGLHKKTVKNITL